MKARVEHQPCCMCVYVCGCVWMDVCVRLHMRVCALCLSVCLCTVAIRTDLNEHLRVLQPHEEGSVGTGQHGGTKGRCKVGR